MPLPTAEVMLHGVTKVEVKKRHELGSGHYFKFHETVKVLVHYREGLTFELTLFGPHDQKVEIVINDPR